MEKQKPHYDLARIKELLSSATTRRVTETSQDGAKDLGYMDISAMLEVIDKLCARHFYKAMTSIHNNKLWQDVYKFTDEENRLYIKLQLSIDEREGVLVQFKEDTSVK